MSQDARGGKSFGKSNRTIAALEFHNELVRQKGFDAPMASDHNQILGNMVDLHHRNMSMARANLLKFQPLKSRSSHGMVEEVEEFGDDSDGEAESADVRGGAQTVPSASDAPDCVVPTKPVASMTAKKCTQTADPIAFHRQMRAGTMSRTTSQHVPSSLKGSYAFLPPPPELEEDDNRVTKADLSTLRAKSFLSGPDQQAGAAYDMLSQIRGPNWESDSSVIKSSKSMAAKGTGSSFILGTSRSGLHGEVTLLSTSLGSTTSVQALSAAKSFTAGAGKGPSALPRVSVDSSPSPVAHDRAPGRNSGAGVSPAGGFFSRLKHMMKH